MIIANGYKLFNKWICKRKGHNYKHHHREADGWGNEWHWKQCERCEESTFDIVPVKKVIYITDHS